MISCVARLGSQGATAVRGLNPKPNPTANQTPGNLKPFAKTKTLHPVRASLRPQNSRPQSSSPDSRTISKLYDNNLLLPVSSYHVCHRTLCCAVRSSNIRRNLYPEYQSLSLHACHVRNIIRNRTLHHCGIRTLTVATAIMHAVQEQPRGTTQ